MQNSTSWTIGKVAGTPVNVRPSALLLIVVFSALYYPTFAGYVEKGSTAVIASVVLALVLVCSVFLHEVAHVLTAKAFGVSAVEIGLTFFGGHAGFKRDFSKAWHSFVVSVSGPLTNLLLGGVLVVVAHNVEVVPRTLMLFLVAQVAGTMNLFLGAFNLLPGLPLDGGNALSALVWGISKKQATGTKVAARAGQVVCIVWLLIAIGLPLLRGQGLNTFSLVWTLLVVWVLWSGANSALKGARTREKLAGIDVSKITSPVVLADGSQTIGSLTATLMSAPPTAAIITIDDQNVPSGFVDPQALRSVPLEHVDSTPVQAVTVPLAAGALVPADSNAEMLLRTAQQDSQVRNLFVLEHEGQITGVVWVAHLIRAINLD